MRCFRARNLLGLAGGRTRRCGLRQAYSRENENPAWILSCSISWCALCAKARCFTENPKRNCCAGPAGLAIPSATAFQSCWKTKHANFQPRKRFEASGDRTVRAPIGNGRTLPRRDAAVLSAVSPFVVVIPARYASARLPGKPLADIAGKPMVVHVAERARESGAREIIVATDDRRIQKAVEEHGHDAVLTRPEHASGTDRIAEIAITRGWPDDLIVVNVQGDEPRMPPQLVRAVAQQLADHRDAPIATACHRIHSAADMFDTNVVKVVLDKQGYAAYFSRAPIPYARDAFKSTTAHLPDELPVYRHLGLYAYRCSFLKIYSTLIPAAIERFESLEQLRALWHGYRISVAITDQAPHPGVDTPEDLQKVRQAFLAAG